MNKTKNVFEHWTEKKNGGENKEFTEEISVLEPPQSVELGSLIKKTLGPLADDYSIRILSATQGKGKTIRELSRELDIPIATCYRRITELLEASLLTTVGRKLTQEGKRASVLKSNIANIEVSFSAEDGKLKVVIKHSRT